MSLRNTTISYGSVAKFLHWLIFISLFFMIIFGYLLEDIPKEYQRQAYNIHKLTGLVVLLLIVFRIFWAFLNPKPFLPFNTPRWQRMSERLVHYSLYLFLIAMPLSGWIGSVAGDHIPHLGDIMITLPIEKDKALSEFAFSLHYWLAILIITFVCIHVAAALYHHFVKKDDILRRMLPW